MSERFSYLTKKVIIEVVSVDLINKKIDFKMLQAFKIEEFGVIYVAEKVYTATYQP